MDCRRSNHSHHTSAGRLPRAAPLAATLVVCFAAVTCAAEVAAPAVRFDRDVLPIISSRCFQCHGPDESTREAELRLDQRDDATRERDGQWIIKPGSADQSALIARVTSKDHDELMPPAHSGPPLSPAEVDTLRRWIAAGAPYTQHWAFVAPQRPAAPEVTSSVGLHNPIDNFIVAELRQHKLQLAPAADRYTLIRRLSLDLVGLPPTPEEVDAFVADRRPDAYERLVDRLLAAPAYGERWARMWLDLARYADSAGYGSDPLRLNIWPYRDWLIGAFNKNQPYDRFTLEQLAGDLLPDATEAQRVATAFHRNTMTNTEGGTDDEEFRVAAVKDRIATTMQVWMGLTMGCAQCHTHKFDPITHKEYYRFFAIFNQTEDFDQPDERPTMPLYAPEQQKQRQALEAQIAALEKSLNGPQPKLAAELTEWEDWLRGGRDWSPLASASARTYGGATLKAQDDGSFRAEGKNIEADTYAVSGTSDLKQVTALRLEMLPDDPLPKHGPGRGEDGTVEIDALSLYLADKTARPAARYVRVELPGGPRILSLAEVQVFSDCQNIAPRGKASQSSTYPGGEAAHAIDGNTSGVYADKSTTHTNSEENAWWEVDLGQSAPVEAIVLWNRTDRAMGTRLSKFKVIALDAERKPLAERTINTPPEPDVVVPLAGRAVKLVRQSTSDGRGGEAAKATDGKDNTYWGVAASNDKPVTAIFELSKPEVKADAPPQTWTLVIEHARRGQPRNLGRFRWSLTTRKLPMVLPPPAVRAIVETAADKRTPAQQQQFEAFFRPSAPSLVAEYRKLEGLRTQLAAIKPADVPIMRELAADKHRKSFVLTKGNFLTPGDEVQPGYPQSFSAPPSDAPLTRLGVARWLTSRDNPLTARVAVNRFWAQLFGTGIVETEEDFGTQGQIPSHPELLDWLAIEFMERGWDMKALLKLMVTSATYRQSSAMVPEGLARDARNRLLWRYPRRRLEAEAVRDQALLFSGLLSHKLGGPSVYPPQPEGLWRAAFNGQRSWATSTGEDRYRRGMYTFWRRTVPYPSMVTFDAPSRENCTLRRLPTNTPLQALVTLNDPAYVEMAQALGRRLMNEAAGATEARVKWGLRLVLSRPAEAKQAAALVALYESSLAHYQSQPEEARKMATDPLGKLPEGADVAAAAAWTVVANVLLNLDGVLTKG
ncbi:MAG: DUF1553 domain-containing protein [Planctomycetes bacterium]|nr:DUF1553 domain-containing protein [Planctomycetota bacterium]